MCAEKESPGIGRREFIQKGAAAGVGAATLARLGAADALAAPVAQLSWDRMADVVIAGAGASGIAAAISARDHGATVIAIDENHAVGGHAILSGGRVPLGGGTSLQKKYGVSDSADQVYLDHTNFKNAEFRYADRELVRMWADENAPTFEFLLENGVRFREDPPEAVNGSDVPRMFRAALSSNDLKETINGSDGSGVMLPLAASARAKGVTFLLSHKLTRIVRESPTSGRVVGIVATSRGKDVRIRATRGVILATGGHTSNVEFRRMFDPRLTEEYQTTGEPWSNQNADSEILAMAIGGVLWATANQTSESGVPITKTRHIGCRYGYQNLKWNPQSPMFKQAGASPMPAHALEETVSKYNSYVDSGRDPEFGRPMLLHKVEKPPFYAAWSTPILHDTLSGLRINSKCQVLDLQARPIPSLYCCGEAAGGFALHGLPRVLVFGRVAGREAAAAKT